jgi:hypothetical protein
MAGDLVPIVIERARRLQVLVNLILKLPAHASHLRDRTIHLDDRFSNPERGSDCGTLNATHAVVVYKAVAALEKK